MKKLGRREMIKSCSVTILSITGCVSPDASEETTSTTQSNPGVDIRVINNVKDTKKEISVQLSASKNSTSIVDTSLSLDSGDSKVINVGIAETGSYFIQVSTADISKSKTVRVDQFAVDNGRNLRVEVRPDDISIGSYE
jgi:hypothetical protein